jgi:hypothetical protein
MSFMTVLSARRTQSDADSPADRGTLGELYDDKDGEDAGRWQRAEYLPADLRRNDRCRFSLLSRQTQAENNVSGFGWPVLGQFEDAEGQVGSERIARSPSR